MLPTSIRDIKICYTLRKDHYVDSRAMKDNYASSKFSACATVLLTEFHLCILVFVNNSIAYN